MTRKEHDRWTRVALAIVAGALLMGCASSILLGGATGPAIERSVWEGVYTDAQASRGEEVFSRQCIECHADKPGQTAGDGSAPSLIGEDFRYRWTDASIADLFDAIRQTMPEAAPNSLSPSEYAAVTAYLLELNEYPAGEAELDPGEYKELGRIIIDEGPPGV